MQDLTQNEELELLDDGEKQDLRNSVFSNQVVWRNLGQFLNFGDLKACRLVSTNFNRQVLDCTDFKRRAVVDLRCNHVMQDVFGKTDEKWRNIKLPICGCLTRRDLSWLYPLMEEIESLALNPNCKEGELKRLPEYVIDLLRAPKEGHLRRLYVSPLMLILEGRDELRPARDVLNNIKELELVPMLFGSRIGSKLEEGCLAELVAGATNLRRVDVSGLFTLEYENSAPINRILSLETRNRDFLLVPDLVNIEKIPLDSGFSGIFSESPSFAVLKKFGVNARNLQRGELQELFKPNLLLSLEELCLTCLRPGDFVILLGCIRNKGQNLKSLVITGDGIEENDPSLFKYFKDLPRLEQFTLAFERPDPEENIFVHSFSPAQILPNLPSGVRKIKLWSNFWTFSVPLTWVQFAQLQPNRLTVLILNGRESGVTDETAEFICRNCIMLRELDLSHSKCTDYGFTGIKPGESADSSEFKLSDLEGLRSLTLDGCRFITDQTLISAIRFRELKSLSLSGNHRNLTVEGLKTALRQNPSLESLKFEAYFAEAMPSFEELCTIAPRLRKLYFINKGSDDEESEHEEEEDVAPLEQDEDDEGDWIDVEEGDEEGLTDDEDDEEDDVGEGN